MLSGHLLPTFLLARGLNNDAAAHSPAFFWMAGEKFSFYTWNQLAGQLIHLCNQLNLLDLPPGAHVATYLPNSLAWCLMDLACQTLNYVHVAIDWRWSEPVLRTAVRQSHADVLVTLANYGSKPTTCLGTNLELYVTGKSAFKHPLASLQLPGIVNDDQHSDQNVEFIFQKLSAIEADSPAQILFTSGTTGFPKPVLLSHRNLVTNALAKLDAAPQTSDDLRLNILPFCHAYARTCELSTWLISGGKLAIENTWSGFLKAASTLRPTLVNLVPHLIHKWISEIESAIDPNNLCFASETQPSLPSIASLLGGRIRLLQVGGAALSDTVWQRMAAAGLPPLQGYGLTEASPVICSNRAGHQLPGIVGPPVQGVEVKIDLQGQLWCRGPNVMLGYYNDPEATANRVHDGWLSTGDLAERDASGRLRIVGRVDNRIVLNTGLKVSPEYIESRILSIASIQHALVIGNQQPFLAALIWTEAEKMLANSDWSAIIADALQDIPTHMHPKVVRCLNVQSLDSGLLNAKGQILREPVSRRFSEEIESVFHPERWNR